MRDRIVTDHLARLCEYILVLLFKLAQSTLLAGRGNLSDSFSHVVLLGKLSVKLSR